LSITLCSRTNYVIEHKVNVISRLFYSHSKDFLHYYTRIIGVIIRLMWSKMPHLVWSIKRKLWSSGRALGSQSDGCGFDPRPMLGESGVKSHARINFCTQFWFIIENKKNTGNQMGHTKKNSSILKKTFLLITSTV